jgi:predicted secreted protein
MKDVLRQVIGAPSVGAARQLRRSLAARMHGDRMGSGVDRLRRRLADGRSGRVIFLSHCLLNENVRYLGGATRPGAVDELVDVAQRAGVGICQMACPEQMAWGGVLKRHLLLGYGRDRTAGRVASRLLAPVLVAHTRWRYRRLAGRVAAEIADYHRSGLEVVGIVGVDGSPSCGVQHTLDLDRSLKALVTCHRASIDRAAFNDRVLLANLVAGEGLFVAALRRHLQHRHLTVPLYAHDLIAELEGRRDVAPGLQAALVA